MQSRLNMSLKNAFWSYFSMLISLIIQFISRTVFINYLGENYLGVNGLFSNVLGVLSFAELGIGTVMNFSLYKPVAEGDKEKIKTYMFYYKWAYSAIAAIIAILGILLIPFLGYLIKDPGNIGNVTLYYLIFLFNTVTSYFVSYKYSLVNAEQKNYIYTNINLLISLTSTILQIISLMLWQSYLGYLLVAAVFGLFQKIFISKYLDNLHPYLKDPKVSKLSKQDEKTLITKVRALIIHKIGDVSVHQTDNIIVSAFVSLKMVGLISNYNLIINTISNCINVLFSSVTGSLGNLIATESKVKQYEIFCTYRFIGFWFYGFSSIALMTLLSPFITLWIGSTMIVDDLVVGLIILDYYMLGHRICLNNFKSAAGTFEPDKYIALIQAIVNLVLSIILVNLIGLPGVYWGTVIQGLISNVAKPILVYKSLFSVSSKAYFIDSIKYGLAVFLAFIPCWICRLCLLHTVSVLRFIIVLGFVIIIPNTIFMLLFHKRQESNYIKSFMAKLAHKIHYVFKPQ